MNKQRLIFWIGIFLMLLSLSIVGTVLVQQRKCHQKLVFQGQSYCVLNASFYKNELHFTSAQMDAFAQAHRLFQATTKTTLAQLDSLREVSFSQISLAQPDTAQLNQTACQMGAMHAHLKKALFAYYLTLHALCTPEQAPVFEARFAPVLSKECLQQCHKSKPPKAYSRTPKSHKHHLNK